MAAMMTSSSKSPLSRYSNHRISSKIRSPLSRSPRLDSSRPGKSPPKGGGGAGLGRGGGIIGGGGGTMDGGAIGSGMPLTRPVLAS